MDAFAETLFGTGHGVKRADGESDGLKQPDKVGSHWPLAPAPCSSAAHTTVLPIGMASPIARTQDGLALWTLTVHDVERKWGHLIRHPDGRVEGEPHPWVT